MQDFTAPKPPTPVKMAPFVMVIMAMTMIGASSGVLIADRNAVLLLKKEFASQLAALRGYLPASAGIATAKQETPKVIPTGLSSIVAIHYSSKPDSTRMEFDLQAMDLVRTGKLRNPDRIYFDLRDRSREQGTSGRGETKKSISVIGDLLTGVRIAQRKKGATRVVLDLKRSCDFSYQTSFGPPSRLMVEIQPHPAGTSAYE